MKRFLSHSVLAICLTIFIGVGEDISVVPQAQAQEEADKKPKKLSRGERNRQRIMARYEASGKTETCIPMRRLGSSIVFDDQTIFFQGRGKRAYLNRLPAKCAGLAREERFAYANSFGSLCRAEIITVLDSFGRAWGSCGLGSFEEMVKKPKTESAE